MPYHQHTIFIIWAASWKKQQNDSAPSEDSDQPGHPPSLITVFAVRSVDSSGPELSSCGQRRLWSGWADAQADLSLHWAQPHCWFCYEVAQFCFVLLLSFFNELGFIAIEDYFTHIVPNKGSMWRESWRSLKPTWSSTDWTWFTQMARVEASDCQWGTDRLWDSSISHRVTMADKNL